MFLLIVYFCPPAEKSCNDIATFKTLDACIAEATEYEKTNRTKSFYRCEGRTTMNDKQFDALLDALLRISEELMILRDEVTGLRDIYAIGPRY